ncbi:MAG TPA: helix-turn-helix domain-containing protein [Bacillales bacterium]|nr:helix-turn-helix domain-containing protein [Bacillales bacterium]
MSELGETLRNTRKEKGISLDELQASTKIQKRYLEAVEKGQFEQLPGRFYARAFIKSYAEAVGLDPDELFDAYSKEVPMSGDSVPEQLPSRSRRTRTRTPRVSSPSKASSSASSILPKIIAAVAIVGLFAAIWFAFQKIEHGPSAGSDPQDSASEVEFTENPDVDKKPAGNDEDKPSSESSGKNNGDNNEESKTDQPEKPEKPKQVLTKTGKEGSVFHYTLKNTDQFKLKLSVVDGNSWLEVRKSGASGEKYLYDTKESGFSVTKNLSDNGQVFLKIGSTPHVKMFINGKAFVYPSDDVFQKFLITFQKSENVS